MDKHEQAIVRGEEAARMLASEIFNAAFDDTRAALQNTWSALDSTDGRYAEFAKDLHRKIKLLDSVRRCVEKHIATGKLAAHEIDGRKRNVFGIRA